MRGYFQSTHDGFLNRRSHVQLLKVNLVIRADFLSIYARATLGGTNNNKLFSNDGFGVRHHSIVVFSETDVTEMSVA